MIVQMSGFVTLVVDFVAWLAIHVMVSVAIRLIPAKSFNAELWLFRERSWEKGGKIYERFFHIKDWKGWLPDGAAVERNGFRKKRLKYTHNDYLRRFIQETCRAELIHLGIFILAPLFFIWNDWWIGFIMITYAIAVNIPCVITQRYNRIRLKRIYLKQHTRALLVENGELAVKS